MTDEPVAELNARTPLNALSSRVIGSVTLNELTFDAITSIAPFKDQEKPVSEALKQQIGAGFPKPNRATGKAGARVVWSGLGQAFVLGPPPRPIQGAAMTDQSDAWACAEIKGPGAPDVLARLTPLDLRQAVFKTGHAARTEIAHMSGLILRIGADRYVVMVMRSMAQTLLHEVERAMQMVAARDDLGAPGL